MKKELQLITVCLSLIVACLPGEREKVETAQVPILDRVLITEDGMTLYTYDPEKPAISSTLVTTTS